MKSFILIKRIFFIILYATMQMVAFANYDSMPIGYHSVGVDTYSDGVTPVLNGECYALVWIAEGCDFKGFKCDGTLVDAEHNKIVDDDGMLYICPIAKDGKCPPVSFLVKSTFSRNSRNGEYRVVVLDTRTTDSTLCRILDNNAPVRINGWGFANVSPAKSVSALNEMHKFVTPGNIVDVKSELPDDMRMPVITEFKFDKDCNNALIKFCNTMECFSYFAEYGETVNTVGESRHDELIVGSNDASENFIISIPASKLPPDQAFFKISAKTDWVSGDQQ